MKTHEKCLEEWNADTVELLDEAKDKVDAVLEPHAVQFQKNSLDNIVIQFGEFLYTALGDRVTGQRSSVLNTTYFEENPTGKQRAQEAENKKVPIEEYIKQWQNDNQHGYYHTPTQSHITVGRKFGVSYPAGNGSRCHTIYFDAAMCFKYLTQEHVDCVKNKKKRECVQQFFDFKTDFMVGVDSLVDQLVPVSVPIRSVKVSKVSKSFKNNITYTCNDSSYLMIDDFVDGEITHVYATIQSEAAWNKYDTVKSEDARKGYRDSPTFISLIFFNIDEERKKYKIVANVDMDMEDVSHSLHVATDHGHSETTKFVDCHKITNIKYDSAFKFLRNSTRIDPDGIILNMDEVLQNPIVKEELEKRIRFYNEMSDRLQRMKHDNATLYFLNCDI